MLSVCEIGGLLQPASMLIAAAATKRRSFIDENTNPNRVDAVVARAQSR